MIDITYNKLKEAKNKLSKISNTDANTTNMIMQLTKSIEEAIIHVNEQQNWLKMYFSKGKSGRKSMFYERKVSLFGIPLN